MQHRVDTLTARQKEVLRLVAEGLTSREIAAVLHLSTRTIEVHRWEIMRRLQVRNVAQLLRHALLTDLLPRQAFVKSAEMKT